MREELRRQVEALLSANGIDYVTVSENGVSLTGDNDYRSVDLACLHINSILRISATFSSREDFIYLEEL